MLVQLVMARSRAEEVVAHREHDADIETATTHDRHWNAAMREMVATGFMHNSMRGQAVPMPYAAGSRLTLAPSLSGMSSRTVMSSGALQQIRARGNRIRCWTG